MPAWDGGGHADTSADLAGLVAPNDAAAPRVAASGTPLARVARGVKTGKRRCMFDRVFIGVYPAARRSISALCVHAYLHINSIRRPASGAAGATIDPPQPHAPHLATTTGLYPLGVGLRSAGRLAAL